MLTFVAPFVVYLMSFPVMFITLRKTEVGILFFILFVPVIAIMKKIVEFPLGNQFADLLLMAIILGWIFKGSKGGKRFFQGSSVNFVVILVIMGSVINLIRGYTYMGFTEDIGLIRLQAWKNYMILPVLYFIALNNVKGEKFLKRLILCISITMLAMDFNFYSTFKWMRAEHYRDSIRISGPFSFLGPNELGVFYCLYTFLLLGISYFIDDKKLKYFALFVCACNLYPIMFSYSRAAYISTIAGLLSIGLLKDRRFLALVVLLLALYSFVLPTSVVERINLTFLEQGNVSEAKQESSALDVGGVELDTVGRKELWNKALSYFQQEPLMGIGFDTFRHREGMITHNMYIKILAEQGLVGMLIFAIFTIVVLYQSFRLFRHSKSRLGQGIGLGFVLCEIVHLTGSLTGDLSLYYNLMAIYWVFLGVVASLNKELEINRLN